MGENSSCQPRISEDNWCVAKPDAKPDDLSNGIAYVCGEGGVDCALISNTSVCQFPQEKEAHYKATWAFDAFFQRNKKMAGNKACDFDGLATITWPENTPCRPSKSENQWCLAKRDVSLDALVKDISYVCNIIDCSLIGEGGKCMFPVGEEVAMKADWAFNQYYQQHQKEGNRACDFGGRAELVSSGTKSVLKPRNS